MKFCLIPAFLVCLLCYFSLTNAQNVVKYSGFAVAPLNPIQVDNSSSIFCYRCNRGRGAVHNCGLEFAKNTSVVVRGCQVCMKIKTIEEYRNRNYVITRWGQQGSHFNERVVISRACIEHRQDARLINGCVKDKSHGGTIERCYCNTDLCNSGIKATISTMSLLFTAIRIWM